MSIYKQDYFGFVYLWFDRKRRMYYVGSHQGSVDDGYVGSNPRLQNAHRKRPEDFKRRILRFLTINDYKALHAEEQKWLDLIKVEELGKRYYNFKKAASGFDSEFASFNNKKRLESGNHHFLDKNWQLEKARKQVENGTNVFFNREIALKNNLDRVKKGTHPFLGPEQNNARVKLGTHPFLGSKSNKKMLSEGNHPSQKLVTCPHCGFTTGAGNAKRWHFDNCKKKDL